MAFRIRRLVSVASSSFSISTLIAANNKNKCLTSLNARSVILQTWNFNLFCTDHAIPTLQVDTITFQDNGKTNLEFFKWCNGGGTFHKSACVHPTAVIEVGAVVHSQSLVEANVYVGSGAIVGPAVTIGESTRIGEEAYEQKYRFYPQKWGIEGIMFHSLIASLVNPVLSIMGSALAKMVSRIPPNIFGFGFFVDEQGNMVKKPQNLKAKIGNHVEIGANTCIDRGSWRDTIVGDHSKIDNLVQIGHNVIIGKGCIICGQVGIAGSVTIGEYVTLGGRVAIRDHVCISSRVRLAANSCVTKDISQPGDYGGFPAMPIAKWRRQVATQSRILSKEN